MSFLNKVRTLTLGAAHDLLDKAIDLNSPSAVRQSVRDMEAAITELKSNAAIQDGNLRTQIREQSELTATVAADKATIAKLLTSTDATAPAIAKAKANLVIQNQKHLSDMSDSITSQQNIATQMKATVVGLEAKHDQMVSRVHELERLDRDTKAKESAASAINAAGSVAGNIDSVSVDDLADRMRRRNDVASAQFDQAAGSINTDAPDSDDVNALLASLAPQTAVAK